MKALCFDQFGDPDVLDYRLLPDPILQKGEIIIRTKAIGLNFADIYRRNGNYHLVNHPPYILGYEGAGIVEEVADDVPDIKPGDRMAFADAPLANAERVKVPFEKAIPLPTDISFETAAAVLLQGLTAQYLTYDSHNIQVGEVAVIHAISGGVGQFLSQIIKNRNGTVIGLTSSIYKRDLALTMGADIVFLYSDDWVNGIKEWTGGKGVDVVYDSVGTTLNQSFETTRTGGHVVFYGMAGGNPTMVDPLMLLDTSKTITGGDLWNVLTNRKERIKRSTQLFNWIKEGKIILQPPTIYHLSQGSEAHRFLESRKSTGKILLTP